MLPAPAGPIRPVRAAAAATNATIKLVADSDDAPLDEEESLADEESGNSLL